MLVRMCLCVSLVSGFPEPIALQKLCGKYQAVASLTSETENSQGVLSSVSQSTHDLKAKNTREPHCFLAS